MKNRIEKRLQRCSTLVSPALAPHSSQGSRRHTKRGREVSDELADGLVEELGPARVTNDVRVHVNVDV